jgi:hypothetical protein
MSTIHGFFEYTMEERLMEETQKCINAMDFMKDWASWRGNLQDAIKRGRDFGMSDDMIQNLSVKVGDFLAKKVCPATPEEQLMKDLWEVATQEERKTLATLMFKLVEK